MFICCRFKFTDVTYDFTVQFISCLFVRLQGQVRSGLLILKCRLAVVGFFMKLTELCTP